MCNVFQGMLALSQESSPLWPTVGCKMIRAMRSCSSCYITCHCCLCRLVANCMLPRALPWRRAKSGRGTSFGVHSHGLYYFAAGCTFMAVPSPSLSLIVVRVALHHALFERHCKPPHLYSWSTSCTWSKGLSIRNQCSVFRRTLIVSPSVATKHSVGNRTNKASSFMSSCLHRSSKLFRANGKTAKRK